MINIRLFTYILFTSTILISCIEEDGNDLPSVEERTNVAVSALKTDLISPPNGWKLEYTPTDESGVFFMLLDFKDDGTVEIKSDVADQGGEFFDQSITWRIDNALGLELIMETYGVFHYLFEQDGATFGAEFEFIFQGKEGENLVFRSASDIGPDPSTLLFEPASANDEDLFAREIAGNLHEFAVISPRALTPPNPKQHILLVNANVSILWSLDPAKRIVSTILAGNGTDFYQPGFNPITLDHSSGYKLQSGKMVLLEPLNFTLNNTGYTIDVISFTDFSLTGPAFCSITPDNGPVYTGQISGLGTVRMTGSLFDPEGTSFLPIPEFPYSVNSFFIFDETGASLSDDGNIIAEKFPGASGFLFYYGYESDSLLSNAVGFILEREDGTTDIVLREFMATSTIGNRIQIVLTDNFYHSNTPDPIEEASLTEITNLIFEGEFLYASDLPVEGLTVYNLINPCNQYEVFLVK